MEPNVKKGYVYMMKNRQHSSENLCKIGMTNDPERRLSEAQRETYSVPEWYYVYLKEVADKDKSEKTLHSLLDLYNCRKYPEYPKKEFFEIHSNQVKTLFDVIPGTYRDHNNLPNSIENQVVQLSDDTEESEEEQDDTSNEVVQNKNEKRNMRDYLSHNSQIRHRLADGDEWIGIYNYESNCIDYDEHQYNSPTAFAVGHWMKVVGLKSKRSGWGECFVYSDITWKVLKNLPKIQIYEN